MFALGRNVRDLETAEVLFEYGADLIALPSLLPKLPLQIAAILTVCISVGVTDRPDQRLGDSGSRLAAGCSYRANSLTTFANGERVLASYMIYIINITRHFLLRGI